MSAILPAYLPPVPKQSPQDEKGCHLTFEWMDELLMLEESKNQMSSNTLKIFSNKSKRQKQ